MKTKILTALAAAVFGLILSANAIHAQAGQGAGPGGVKQGGGVAKALGLTEDQKAKMKALREEFAPRRKEIMDAVRGGTMTREEAKAKGEALKTELQARLATILTPEQMQKAQAGLQNRMQKQNRGGKQNAAANMMKDLNLTEQQKADIKAIRQSHGEKVKAIQEQVKSGALTQEQAREKTQALRKEMMDQVKAKLTPEQQAKAQQMLESRRNNKPAKGPRAK